MLAQPRHENSYWTDAINSGIYNAALRYGDRVEQLKSDDDLHRASGAYVLTVGYYTDWLESRLTALDLVRANPVIVNACMLPLQRCQYSGVVFELEKIISDCVSGLYGAGAHRIAFLGANPSSVTDRVKCSAFPSQRDVIFAGRHIDECVDRFIDSLGMTGYDAALCANDTVAVCLYSHLTRRGIHIPDDFLIFGMGNSYIGSRLRTPLTSISFDYREMGEQAVRLVHFLRRNAGGCHVTFSLPCRLIVRSSAGNIREPGVSTSESRSSVGKEDSGYFGGSEIDNIIRVEAILQSADEIDREIIFALAAGSTSEQIAEQVWLSERAVRYRVSNLLRRCGIKSRAELICALRRASGVE